MITPYYVVYPFYDRRAQRRYQELKWVSRTEPVPVADSNLGTGATTMMNRWYREPTHY